MCAGTWCIAQTIAIPPALCQYKPTVYLPQRPRTLHPVVEVGI